MSQPIEVDLPHRLGKDEARRRMSGRAPDNRLVHFTPDPDSAPRPGDMVTVQISYAAPHHLVADGPVLGQRRTRAGDAWQARQAAGCRNGVSTDEPGPVLIGMPAVPVRG